MQEPGAGSAKPTTTPHSFEISRADPATDPVKHHASLVYFYKQKKLQDFITTGYRKYVRAIDN